VGEFEILPHTADVGFRARGESLADLFETAARAMFSLEYEPASVPLEEEVEVRAEGGDPEAALYGWLSELIWLHDAEGFVPGEVRVSSLGPPRGGWGLSVEGRASGAPMAGWFVQTGPQLKAVTMYGLEVGRRDGGYEAVVYLDV
jgi:SHS2 domain-containing protein